jgi:hypothetical protein
MNHYYLAMYYVTHKGNNIEEASFFIRSSQTLDRQQVQKLIKKEGKYKSEVVIISALFEIDEKMFRDIGGNQDADFFKID